MRYPITRTTNTANFRFPTPIASPQRLQEIRGRLKGVDLETITGILEQVRSVRKTLELYRRSKTPGRFVQEYDLGSPYGSLKYP